MKRIILPIGAENLILTCCITPYFSTLLKIPINDKIRMYKNDHLRMYKITL